ncbi:MAG: hypothetical protein DID90_2727552627 [Candidatus Nitrotoga sp. LAW]|nr:MAG: hypothetical protein DID90_2727552627 [Candidatus Nitrotoga sp. LAW]
MRQQTLATGGFEAYRKTTHKTKCCRAWANLCHGLNSVTSLNPTILKRETDQSDWNECDACTSSDGLWQYTLRTVSHAVGRTCTTCAKARDIKLCRQDAPRIQSHLGTQSITARLCASDSSRRACKSLVRHFCLSVLKLNYDSFSSHSSTA